jgi:hypothetical protein
MVALSDLPVSPPLQEEGDHCLMTLLTGRVEGVRPLRCEQLVRGGGRETALALTINSSPSPGGGRSPSHSPSEGECNQNVL